VGWESGNEKSRFTPPAIGMICANCRPLSARIYVSGVTGIGAMIVGDSLIEAPFLLGLDGAGQQSQGWLCALSPALAGSTDLPDCFLFSARIQSQ
jgi:hypothetical protein